MRNFILNIPLVNKLQTDFSKFHWRHHTIKVAFYPLNHLRHDFTRGLVCINNWNSIIPGKLSINETVIFNCLLAVVNINNFSSHKSLSDIFRFQIQHKPKHFEFFLLKIPICVSKLNLKLFWGLKCFSFVLECVVESNFIQFFDFIDQGRKLMRKASKRPFNTIEIRSMLL